MEFIKKILHLHEDRAEDAADETVIVSEPRNIVEVTLRKPEPEIEAPAAAPDAFFDDIFHDFLREDPPFMAILFDAEEEQCFIYYFRDREMKKIKSIPVIEWKPRIEHLKSLNHKRANICAQEYLVGILISFSNFGERLSVVLEPLAKDAELKLREKMKNCIRLENALKPPTSLTELNKEHLAGFVEKYREKTGVNLIEILEKEGLVTEELRRVCEILPREGQSIESLLIRKGVFPRKLLARIVAGWAGFEYSDIDEEEIDYSLLEAAGLEFCRQYRVVPCQQNETELFAAAADPGDDRMIEALEALFEKKALLKMSAEEDIRNQTEEIFRRIRGEDRQESPQMGEE